jgi:excinuclease ABC subunit A
MIDKITIKGARENNLKNINVEIPKNQLVVITGVSGSGKSSLAFNTIYEEGKRRYMESLSSYARQFLGGNEKPDVDAIEGLCPAIAIDQKTTSHNPRSTVGTVTEIYDYLRILFARIGRPYCPNGHGPIEALTPKQILNLILEKCHDNDKLILLAPVVNNQKGAFTEELNEFRKLGFLRIRIDNEFFSLDDDIKLEKSKHHQIDLVIDRIVVHHDHNTTSRLANSLETALKHGSGKVCVLINDQPTTYSASHSCKICGFSVPDLEPKLFSFNSPTGACEHCKGLGFNFEPDENKMIPDWDLSINEGGIDFFKKSVNSTSINWQAFDALLKHYHIDKNAPLKTLTTKEIKLMLYGSDEPISYSIHTTGGNIFKKHDYIEGVLALVKRLHTETSSESSREFYNKYLSEKICPYCHGKKLSPAALCVKIGHKDIIEFTNFTIVELIDFILNLKLTKNEQEIGKLALAEIVNRLTFLKDVGLGYLTLSRSAATLSGGEAQRIRLATQIGSKLTGILYVLDEPSIGLHQKDNVKLIATIQKMRDLGNTMIVVEHDLDTIAAADYVIEIGPAAGDHGGKLVAAGTPAAIMDNPHSLTGNYLTHKQTIPLPRSTRTGNGKKIIIKGATLNNLKNVEAHFPLGKLICVTGVSGSGKSTLINRILVPNLIKLINQPFLDAPKLKTIVGAEAITKVISVSQEAIGRTPRSNPATYVGVFDDIRELFASTPDAKAKGFTKSRFSFNVPGGCCEKC